ncbi:MAG: polymer-forming cytoskeletal protein [Phycisphaeraceae bacterium]
MPFGPRLFRIRARGNRAADGRAITCPYCQHRFETSGRAISLACPHCHRPLNLGSRTIDHDAAGDVATLGPVRVTASATLAGRLLCNSLVSEGNLAGHTTVLGRVELMPASHTTGQLHARSLHAHHGATLHATAAIGPAPRPPADFGAARSTLATAPATPRPFRPLIRR